MTDGDAVPSPAEASEVYRSFMAVCGHDKRMADRWGTITEVESRFIEAHLRLPRVLVAGCGTGRGVAELLRRGAQVSAVDREPSMMAEVKRRFEPLGVRTWTGEIRDVISFADRDTFDSILCLGLVSGGLFLPGEDLQGALSAVRSVIRPDGTLLFDFLELKPPADRGEVRFFDYPLSGGQTVRGCCYWPTRAEFQRALGLAGFRTRLVVLRHNPEEPLVGAVCTPC